VIHTSLPAGFTAQKGPTSPGYPSFKGIRQARTKPFNTWVWPTWVWTAGQASAQPAPCWK